MRKKFMFLFVLAMGASSLFAGGLLTNTNQSAHFLRNPALDATIEIDGVYANPAGLVFLNDGFHISLSNQSAFQTRTITSTFAPFAGYGGNATKEYGAETTALAIPSIQLAYKVDRFVFSGGFAVVGGGGTAEFKKGLPSFEAPVSMIPLSLTAGGVNTTSYSLDQSMEGKQITYGVQLNASYKITEHLSGALGARLSMMSNAYKGELKNIMINPIHPTLNPTNGMMLATDFFNSAAEAATGASASLQPLVDGGAGSTPISALVTAGYLTPAQATQLSMGLGKDVSGFTPVQVQGAYGMAAASYTENASKVANKNLDTQQSGMGITPIISLHYNMDRLNVAAKYEMKSTIMLTNKTTVDDIGAYADGAETPSDIPAFLSAGADFNITDSWKVSGGYHHFFDSDAKMANDKQKFINGGSNEYLAGTEYKINDMFLVSTGIQFTKTAVTDAYQSDLSFSLNSYSVGLGGAIDVTPKLRINLAYFFTNYSDWTKASGNYNNTTPAESSALSISGSDTYARTSNVLGIGLEYKF